MKPSSTAKTGQYISYSMGEPSSVLGTCSRSEKLQCRSNFSIRDRNSARYRCSKLQFLFRIHSAFLRQEGIEIEIRVFVTRGYFKPKERDTMCTSRFTRVFPPICLNFLNYLQKIVINIERFPSNFGSPESPMLQDYDMNAFDVYGPRPLIKYKIWPI